MKFHPKDPMVPTYVIQAVIAGLCFLLVALFLGILIFAQQGEDAFSQEETANQDGVQTIEKKKLNTRFIVVLDAGHGGHDPGAVSPGGVTEAEIVQQVLDKTAALLADQPKIQVEFAHPAGTSATPMDRANLAVQLGADLLVSLHLNADGNPATRGFQVFPSPPGRTYHEESLDFARHLMQYIPDTGVPVLGGNGIFYHYYNELPQGGYWKEFVDSTGPGADVPRKEESFGVVEYGGCPAVLVEMWHISNQQDMSLLYNTRGMDAMAHSLYRAICDYFQL